MLNRVFLIGRPTRDPETRESANGAGPTRCGLAVNRRWTGADGKTREEATFLDLVFWGKQADVARAYLRKGRLILVEGRVVSSKWETRAGERRTKVEVAVDRFQFLGRPDRDEPPAEKPTEATPAGEGTP